MPEAFSNLTTMLTMATAAIAAIVALSAAGRLDRDSLALAPPRELGLETFDLFAGLLLLMGGSMIVPMVAKQMGILDGIESRPLTYAIVVLLSQFIGQGPTAAYFLYRTHHAREQAGPAVGMVAVAAAALAILAAVPITLALNFFMVAFGELLGYPEPTAGHEMLTLLIESQSMPARALMIVSAVAVAPVLEEVLFRGLFQSAVLASLGPGRRWTAIILASLLFAFVHLGSAAWQTLPGLFVLSLFFGWLYERHGSLLPSMIAHAAFNGMMVTAALVMGKG